MPPEIVVPGRPPSSQPGCNMFGVLEPGKIGLSFREKLEGCGGIDPIPSMRGAFRLAYAALRWLWRAVVLRQGG